MHFVRVLILWRVRVREKPGRKDATLRIRVEGHVYGDLTLQHASSFCFLFVESEGIVSGSLVRHAPGWE
jgi:hypothetical protein